MLAEARKRSGKGYLFFYLFHKKASVNGSGTANGEPRMQGWGVWSVTLMKKTEESGTLTAESGMLMNIF